MAKSSPELQSTPEIIVAQWLDRHKIIFTTQERFFGGTTQAGGALVDFILPFERIAIRVQSYWHLEAEAVARDALQKERLTADWTVVDVWEERLLENVDTVMSAALEGRELGRP